MKKNQWIIFAPWFLTIACTVMLGIIGYFLVINIEWYKAGVFSEEIKEANQPEYRFYAYHLHLSMIKRSIGLFSGFAIMFLGLGVVFFTLRNVSNVDVEQAGFKAKIATASPGIIALLVGAYLIVSSIASKDNFPVYSTDPGMIEKPMDPTLLPKLPNN